MHLSLFGNIGIEISVSGLYDISRLTHGVEEKFIQRHKRHLFTDEKSHDVVRNNVMFSVKIPPTSRAKGTPDQNRTKPLIDVVEIWIRFRDHKVCWHL